MHRWSQPATSDSDSPNSLAANSWPPALCHIQPGLVTRLYNASLHRTLPFISAFLTTACQNLEQRPSRCSNHDMSRESRRIRGPKDQRRRGHRRWCSNYHSVLQVHTDGYSHPSLLTREDPRKTLGVARLERDALPRHRIRGSRCASR